jgi:uncharacterized membrane protein
MKYKFILFLFLLSFIASAMLSFSSPSETCLVAESTCSVIEQSVYAQTFGIKNSYYGVGIFAFLLFLTYSHIRKPRRTKQHIINFATTIGAIIALYFIYLQQFVLEAYCMYCLVVDISLILAVLILMISYKMNKRKLRKWNLE